MRSAHLLLFFVNSRLEIMGELEDKDYVSDESFGMGEADSRNLEIVGEKNALQNSRN